MAGSGPIVNVNVLADTKKFSDAMRRAGDDTDFLTKGLKGIGIAAGVAMAAAGAAAVAFGAASIKAAAEAEAVTKGLENATKNAGLFGESAADIDKATKALDDHSTKIAELTGIDDELFNTIKTGWLAVPQLAALGTDGINNLAQVTADVAAGTGKDLQAIATAFIKVAGDQETALSKLTRQGIVLSDEQKKTYQAFLDTNQEAAAQNFLITTLGQKYAGAAVAMANPLDRLKVIFENLKETIGKAFLPAIEKIVPVVSSFINTLTASPEFQAFIEGLGVAFGELMLALEPLMPVLLDLMKALLPVIVDLIKMLAPVVVDLVKAFAPLIPVLAEIVRTLLPPLVEIIQQLIKYLIDNPDFMKNATESIKTFAAILEPVRWTLQTVADLLKQVNDNASGAAARAAEAAAAGKTAVNYLAPQGQAGSWSGNYQGNWGQPRLAEGGIVMPRPGGVSVTVAEAGQPEAVIPLSKMGSMGTNITIQGNVGWSIEEMADVIFRKQRQAMALAGLNGIVGVR